MDKYFKKGFIKIAQPELAKETSGSDNGSKESDSRKERQRLLEYYENQSSDKGKAVEEDESSENKQTIKDRY
jgi:hypothetical protein